MKLKSLSRLFALAVLLACFAAATEAPAQNMYGRDYGKGYGFGAGFDNCQQPFAPFAFGNFGLIRPPEEPPYFAKFPPVYYSHIVPRPYGISPYAAPPGIVPAEMFVPQVEREVIKNPYVDEPDAVDPAAPKNPDGQPAPMIDGKSKGK